MANAKGKKLTRQQMKIMRDVAGITDCTDWLYIKTETRSTEGTKQSSKLKPKKIQMVVWNRITNETKYIDIKEV